MNKGFDTIAPLYDRLADIVFGYSIRKAQLRTIAFIPEGATILIIGGGTGWYLQEVLRRQHVKKIVYLEASRRMTALAQQKTAAYLQANPGIVEFRVGKEASIRNNETFDVIILHFLLDLFKQHRVDQMMQVLKCKLKEKGILLFADFTLTKTGAGYWWKRLLIRSMYVFFRICCQVEARTLPDYDRTFSENKMGCIFSASFFHSLITSRVYGKVKVRITADVN